MKKEINLYQEESAEVIKSLSAEDIKHWVEIVFKAYENEKTIFACGNGGNVAAVENLVVDMNMHPFVTEDKGSVAVKRNKFQAVSLCQSGGTLTGVSNDLGFNEVFASQLKYQARPGDVLFAMSGSGNSGNVVRALEYAKEIGMVSVVITRNTPCKSQELADLLIEVKGISKFPGQTGKNNNNFHFEDCISKITHIAVGLLKQKVEDENRS